MTSKIQLLLSAASTRLSGVLEGEGWTVDDPVELEVDGARGSRHPTVIPFGRANDRYEAHLRGAVGSAGFDTLRRALADGLLTGQAASRERGRRPMAIVVATPISAAMIERLGEYCRWVDGEAAWGVVDPHGIVSLFDPQHAEGGAGALLSAEPAADSARTNPAAQPAARAKLFTDLRQWMLKVLLAPRVDEDLLTADRGPIRNATDLADRARVSTSMVSRFLADLEDHGFLERSTRSLRLVRLRDLLDAWRSDTVGQARDVRVRFDLPSGDPAKQLRRLLELESKERRRQLEQGPGHRRPWMCLGLFEACRSLGLGHVLGGPIHFYHEDPDTTLTPRLDSLGLHRVDDRSAQDIYLRRPTAPQSVFRGAVVRDGVPTADVLQCWLDVVDHPTRGAEQAQEIMERIGLLDEGGS
ncbi:MarR family transcriptional regulator [Engelhardtia mirabilis]|uniref:MarR family protein n=1 Tax=Engelhardtia mirabilis TaxID=2528011 RepID=A0A518BRR7_9BACT|nr:MarR family protein [Planctomycetes bacterium Pla133]QDV03976.1 MarR family protein [Planctomycetes bacterium Pla86]